MTMLVRARVRRGRRDDGLPELVRRSAADVAASEISILGALCAGAALLAGGFGWIPALAAGLAVPTGYLALRGKRTPGRMLPLHSGPSLAPSADGESPAGAAAGAGWDPSARGSPGRGVGS